MLSSSETLLEIERPCDNGKVGKGINMKNVTTSSVAT